MPVVRAVPQVRQRQRPIGQGGCCPGAAPGPGGVALNVTLGNPPDGDRPLTAVDLHGWHRDGRARAHFLVTEEMPPAVTQRGEYQDNSFSSPSRLSERSREATKAATAFANRSGGPPAGTPAALGRATARSVHSACLCP